MTRQTTFWWVWSEEKGLRWTESAQSDQTNKGDTNKQRVKLGEHKRMGGGAVSKSNHDLNPFSYNVYQKVVFTLLLWFMINKP